MNLENMVGVDVGAGLTTMNLAISRTSPLPQTLCDFVRKVCISASLGASNQAAFMSLLHNQLRNPG
jgi:hypothetical protein